MSASSFDDLRVLITGACGVTSRTLVRALRRSPLFSRTRLIGCDICDNPYGLYEGLYERIYRVPTASNIDAYGQVIDQIRRVEGIDVALVVPELEVLAWTERSFGIPALLPPPRFSRTAISKRKVHDALSGSHLVPNYLIVSRSELMDGSVRGRLDAVCYPLWLRDVSEGSTSGRGAVLVEDLQQAQAWCELNRDIETYMAAEYLPGRNLACLMLFEEGRVMKRASYERLTYFMHRVSVSGITGNISEGQLIHHPEAEAVAEQAVMTLAAQSAETMRGMVTVDLRCDSSGRPRVTEINLRQVAAASAFAEEPGANLAEAQLLLTLGRANLLSPHRIEFPPHNRLLRDIDGQPVYVANFRELAIGECLPRRTAP